ncbi:ribonuclease Z [Pullulanibacillus sp. KACC 23026]|uniref:ribonuclease Z n=1 Tax=Pullulanibacillus sp. KACC 23026 TaxID=3028315 RepID=UPI0023AEFA74|nr:ribonuclease Z [Pullulanibacillus sp. KACC 23026]WEG14358.1 ribonuclease Z [Pullulanibacillus sp. KACC 23026]
MELVFLGTGAGVPAKHRNVASIALIMPEFNSETWLFDCGEATQHQILETKVKLSKVTKILITHLHGDHIYGLPGLLGSRSFQGGETLLTLYGPKGIKDYVEVSLRISETHLTYPLEIIELEEGTLFETANYKVEVRLLLHGVASYGYRLVEKDKPGALLVDKIKKELGISPGPLLKQFKETDRLVLDDGREIVTADYLGPVKKGRIVAILGDTKPCEGERVLAEGATLLVHEATFMVDKEEGANAFFHSSTRQAAACAIDAHAETLILTHISARYKDEGEALLNEAKAFFPNTYLAEDLWSYTF